jgi:hypothetical protein
MTRPRREQEPTGEAGPGPDPAPAKGGRGGSRRRTLIAFAAAALVLVAVPLAVSHLIDQPEGDEYVFEIPAGTARRLAAGETVEVLPADLRLELRDRLVLVNLDDRPHQVGPFTVDPGQRLDRRFSDAVSFSGFCSLHASGSIDIEVRPQS